MRFSAIVGIFTVMLTLAAGKTGRASLAGEIMKHPNLLKSFLVLLISVAVIGGCNNNGGQVFKISSDFPSDIEGGAPNANLEEAALFAWRQFIALSWPAESDTRDTPDNNELFGDTSFIGPLVWETFRHKVEIYPGTGATPPGFVDDPDQSYGYDEPPVYIYAEGEVEPCTGQELPSEPAWVNLDEISQLGLNSMFAGASPKVQILNPDPQLVRFMAKANRVEYEYVVEPVQSLWNHSDTYNTLKSNFTEVANGNGTPSALPGPVINFPVGTVEIKTAFRELTEEERNSGRFYVTTVRYYIKDDEDPNDACFVEDEWGLISLHIMQKTETAPFFVWATFEQADNLLTRDGDPVEDEEGNLINMPIPTSTTPELTYLDGDPPTLDIVGDEYCTDIGSRLYYIEEATKNDKPLDLPSDGPICQNFRDFLIPDTVILVNKVAHDTIREYNANNGIGDSPWLYYKLVNVQASPLDVTEVDEENTDSKFSRAVFHTANIMVETDRSLQQFSGRISSAGPSTDLPPNFDNFNPDRQTYQNVLTFDSEGNLDTTYDMGGCLGCHGVAQLAGDDFSFILKKGRAEEPEAPDVTPPGTSNPIDNVDIQ